MTGETSQPAPQQSASRPIFVIGSGRSGTTLLRMMLCAHPHIYLTHEAYFYLWDGLLRTRDGDAFVADYLRTSNFRWLGLDVAEFLPQVPRGLPRERVCVLFEAVMRAKARQQGKTRFGDKTPGHSGKLHRIFADFPEARVIRIVRDPRAVVHSLAGMPWSSSTALFGAWITRTEHRQTAPFRERILQVRLEDLLDDPRTVMGKVLDFVGEPWDERVLDHTAHGPGPEDLPPMPWFRAAAEPRAASGPPAWMRWDPATIRLVESITRAPMAEGDYPRAALDSEPSRLDIASHALRELPQMLRDLALLTRLIQRGRDPAVQLETPSQKALFRRLNPRAWGRWPGFTTMPDPPPLRPDWAEAWGTAADPLADAPAMNAASGLPSRGRVLLTPFYAGAIWLEQRAASLFQLRFPRTLAEIEAAPERLFALLQHGAALPPAATLVEIRRRGRMVNEPDKDRTAASLDVVVRHGNTTTVVPVFVKFQSGRGMPLLLQAVRAAVEPGVAREIDFYRRLAGSVPVRAPRAYFADALHLVNRVCLVLEHVDGHNPADWRGCPLPGIRAVLGAVARMNAAFLGRTASDPRTAWIPARAGLDYASFVATLAGDAPAWTMDLWRALERWFRARPITLVHGDCRPGNMLFLDDGDMARQQGSPNELDASPWPLPGTPTPEVVFTDWEAINAAPLLWDFTYCTIIGMRIGDRRAHLPRLLDEFVAALRAEGVPPTLCEPERCRLEVDLLTLVLYYIAALVVSKGYWDNQGNTLDDYRAWSGRILAALHGVDADRAARALGVQPEAVRRLQREAAFKARG